MSEVAVPTKRRVEVSVGAPDIHEGADTDKVAGMPHHDECYFLTFVDVPDDKDDPDMCYNSFSAQVTCLCGLPQATVAWLQGATEEEIQAMLTKGHDDDANHQH